MSLLSELARDFAPSIRSRGQTYERQGKVEIQESAGRALAATVYGTKAYRVRVERDADGDWSYQCSCPFFKDHDEPCKHIWGALLKAHRTGALQRVAGLSSASAAENGGTVATADLPPERPARSSGWMPANKAGESAWKKQLSQLRRTLEQSAAYAPSPLAPAFVPSDDKRIVYVVDVAASHDDAALVVFLMQQTLKGAEWGSPKALKIAPQDIHHLPDAADRQIIQMLVGTRQWDDYFGYGDVGVSQKFALLESAYLTTLRPMCDTGRCLLRREDSDEGPAQPLAWDDGPPWEFWIEVRRSPGGRNYVLAADLRRGEARMEIDQPDILLRGGLMIADGRVSTVETFGAYELLAAMIERKATLTVPGEEADELLRTLFALPRIPRLQLPEELRVEETRLTPKPRLKIKSPGRANWGDERLIGELSFDYQGQTVAAGAPAHMSFNLESRRVVHRDEQAEKAFVQRLMDVGFRQGYAMPPHFPPLRLTPSKLPRVVRDLTNEGWIVEAEGKLYRPPGELNIRVSSGIDWFELHGEVDFGGMTASLPKLLAALRRGEKSIKLDDGTFGLLPEEWLKKYGLLAGVGEQTEDHLRFSKRQVGVLDVLLASMPEVRTDEVFQRARDEMMNFKGVDASDAPTGFQGELRPYQREGLGWMTFLRRFGFGGCLADDMGLGKTVQVLALLESRRQAAAQEANGNGKSARPSLAVVPKSLVFNWKQEAARFTPNMRVLDHTGIERNKETAEHFDQHDLILTTYGTLRRDAELFKDVQFDYIVLDEAQAIKNSASGSAKAARLLRGDHRLALSGTPVQNHLGELWSLFEFLNPGMLGAASIFKTVGAGGLGGDTESREALARALRPFILRRTKGQVARDLPERLEQTLYCELEPTQRKQYEELRDHYRQSLLERVAKEGMNKAKIEVLEALLRLRQAACHPGLIDKARVEEPSAKLDALMEQLLPALDEGHKSLVFSQFTSLLSIVRKRLDAEKVPYEYLDGHTRDRQSRVERFQNDPECKLFLISLKAGGLGLNLTAAEYVFLLDPWWNPAVEAQAIDRAHRIGQTRRVFAYRLIARDTVEEKVLALQQTKRDLADAIIGADNSLISKLGRDDLELLLS